MSQTASQELSEVGVQAFTYGEDKDLQTEIVSSDQVTQTVIKEYEDSDM